MGKKKEKVKTHGEKELRQILEECIPKEAAALTGYHIYSNRLDLKLDFVFKAIFTQNSEESRLVRIDFLSAILGVKVLEAIVSENELAVSSSLEKQSTFDVHLRLENEEEVNVEIQMQNNDHLINRAEFLCCKLFASQDAKGKHYSELSKVYEIMITNFTLFVDRKEFLDIYMYRNAEGKVLSGNTKLIFMELTKLEELLKKPPKELSPAELWALFIKYGNDEKRADFVKQIEERREGIGMASTILNTISKDRSMQLAAIDRYMFEADQVSKLGFAKKMGLKEGMQQGLEKGMQQGLEKGMQQGLEKGIQQGLQEGEHKKAIEIAKQLKQSGTALELIVQCTGLSEEEVTSL